MRMSRFFVVDMDELKSTGWNWYDVGAGKDIISCKGQWTGVVHHELVTCSACLFSNSEVCPVAPATRTRNFYCAAGRRKRVVEKGVTEFVDQVRSTRINPENWDYYA